MAKLVLKKDGMVVNAFSLNGEQIQIGRDQLNHIRLTDPMVSRFHAEIQRQGRSYTLVDRKSTNGTRLNGILVTRPTPLADDDAVGLGDTTLIFRLEPGDTRDSKSPAINSNATLLDAGEALESE